MPGVLVEGVNVSKVKDLKSVYDKIDSLRTIGLTGFLEPLKEVGQLVKRLPTNNIKEMFFLTDGYDNQWSEKEVLNQCKELISSVDNAYIVEYGWYCNTPLIKKMVETLNGVHLFSEDIVSYESIAEKVIAEGATKKVKIQLPEKTRGGLAFYVYNNKLKTINHKLKISRKFTFIVRKLKVWALLTSNKEFVCYFYAIIKVCYEF